MKNIFTRNQVTDVFFAPPLKCDQWIKLTSTDPTYFAVRSFKEKMSLEGTGFTDPFKDISDDGYTLITVDEDSEDSDPKRTLAELDFLSKLSLVEKRGKGEYYVSKFAYVLYDLSDGLFNNFDDRDPPTDKLERMRALKNLCMCYTLPGRYWRAYYAAQRGKEEVGTYNMLDAEMHDIEGEWAELYSL